MPAGVALCGTLTGQKLGRLDWVPAGCASTKTAALARVSLPTVARRAGRLMARPVPGRAKAQTGAYPTSPAERGYARGKEIARPCGRVTRHTPHGAHVGRTNQKPTPPPADGEDTSRRVDRSDPKRRNPRASVRGGCQGGIPVISISLNSPNSLETKFLAEYQNGERDLSPHFYSWFGFTCAHLEKGYHHRSTSQAASGTASLGQGT